MHQNELNDIGSQLGCDAVEHIAQRAEDYSEHERERIELTNEARINALHLEGTHLTAREHQLVGRLRYAPPAGSVRHRQLKKGYYWITGSILAIAAFFFSLLALRPYRLGWIGDLYCLGIALVTPFAVEEFLQAWNSEQLFKGVVTSVFISALVGGALLAAIRGDLLSQQVEQSSPVAVIDDENAPAPEGQNTFYDSTRKSLRLLMLFLAIAIDLGAGVAIHRAVVVGTLSGEDYDKLSEELADVRQQLVAVVCEITALKNAPAIFVAGFWRDFYRALLTQGARKAMTKWLSISLLCLFLFGTNRASAQAHTDVVVAIDLSTSEEVKGHDSVSQFEKNVKGVERLLASVGADSRITVIGITGASFADPSILLKAEISADPGYFGERLAAARRQLLRAWHDRASHLAPTSSGTDILGALRFVSELFQTDANNTRKVLTLYSDMRHVTRGVNLETPLMVPVDSTLATVAQRSLLTDLAGVAVYVLGANADGRQVAEWESLKKFWVRYFERAGATLGGYSMLWDPPKLF